MLGTKEALGIKSDRFRNRLHDVRMVLQSESATFRASRVQRVSNRRELAALQIWSARDSSPLSEFFVSRPKELSDAQLLASFRGVRTNAKQIPG